MSLLDFFLSQGRKVFLHHHLVSLNSDWIGEEQLVLKGKGNRQDEVKTRRRIVRSEETVFVEGDSF